MPKASSPAQVSREVLRNLEAAADPERARQIQRYFKETVCSLGLGSAQVRQIAKDIFQSLKKSWTVKDAIELCDMLFPRSELESKTVAALILLRFKRDFPKALFGRIKTWLEKNFLDNWASVDVFCPEAVGELLVRYPELVEGVKRWTGHSNRWVKRASIVSFLKLTKNAKYLDTIYDITTCHFQVDDDLVQKANGWLLREAGKRDPARLERFLLTHGSAIPRTTLRYAIERFPETKRRELLRRTKS